MKAGKAMNFAHTLAHRICAYVTGSCLPSVPERPLGHDQHRPVLQLCRADRNPE